MTGDLLVTSIVRGAGLDEPSGLLFTVDLEGSRVTGRCAMPDPPLREHDANPRGGMRGAKGIAVVGDRIFIANYSSIHAFDKTWTLKSVISDPGCAGIHDIRLHDDHLWVTSTANDRLFEFDLDGTTRDVLDCRPPDVGGEEDAAGDVDYRDPRTHDPAASDRVHLNSVDFTDHGDMLLSLGRIEQDAGTPAHSAIVRIDAQGERSRAVEFGNVDLPNHNICVLGEERLATLDTNAGDLMLFDATPQDERDRIHVGEEFLRGLLQLSADQVVVGGGAALAVVNLTTRQVEKRIELCDDPRVSVYAIAKLPEGTAPLPVTMHS